MIVGLLVLFGCQLIGEFLVRLIDAPIPGAVVGMMLLLLVLATTKATETGALGRTCNRLLENMQLLFIPAGVGVTQYLGVIGAAVVPISVGLLTSWLAALLVTATVATVALTFTRLRTA